MNYKIFEQYCTVLNFPKLSHVMLIAKLVCHPAGATKCDLYTDLQTALETTVACLQHNVGFYVSGMQC